MYKEELDNFNKLSEEYKGKVDGEIDMDLHGNISIKGMK